MHILVEATCPLRTRRYVEVENNLVPESLVDTMMSRGSETRGLYDEGGFYLAAVKGLRGSEVVFQSSRR
jgi:hypothetical protein